MAEYKEFHCPYGDDFEGGDECDRCEQYELCMETPSADVIECSKIDKAIAEIKERKKHLHTDIYNVDSIEFGKGLDLALKILKEHIGE